MPPKRKSDVLEHPPVAVLDSEAESEKATNAKASDAKPPAAKKARVSNAGEGPSASGSGSKKGKAADAPKCWRDIVLEDEEEVRVIESSYNGIRVGLTVCDRSVGRSSDLVSRHTLLQPGW